MALVKYKGTFIDGQIFDENPQAAFPVGQVVPGFSEALQKMRRGGEYKVWIPSDIGYGQEDIPNPQTGEVVIPSGSLLIFDTTLIDYRSQAEVNEMRKGVQATPKTLSPEQIAIWQKQLDQ